METKLTTLFLSQGWCCGIGLNCRNVNVQCCPSSSHRLLPTLCKMRDKNYRRQHTRKMYTNGLPNGLMQGNSDDDSPESCNRTIDLQDTTTDDYIDNTEEAVQLNEESNSTQLIENISVMTDVVRILRKDEELYLLKPHPSLVTFLANSHSYAVKIQQSW